VLGEVVEERVAGAGAQAPGQRAEELRAPRLVAAAAAEQLAGDRVERVDVRPRERLLRGLLELQPRVDALAVRIDVVDQRPALLAELAQQEVCWDPII
jgi:hypothetical protein